MPKKKKEPRWNRIIFHRDGRTTKEFLRCAKAKKQEQQQRENDAVDEG